MIEEVQVTWSTMGFLASLPVDSVFFLVIFLCFFGVVSCVVCVCVGLVCIVLCLFVVLRMGETG